MVVNVSHVAISRTGCPYLTNSWRQSSAQMYVVGYRSDHLCWKCICFMGLGGTCFTTHTQIFNSPRSQSALDLLYFWLLRLCSSIVINGGGRE